MNTTNERLEEILEGLYAWGKKAATSDLRFKIPEENDMTIAKAMQEIFSWRDAEVTKFADEVKKNIRLQQDKIKITPKNLKHTAEADLLHEVLILHAQEPVNKALHKQGEGE